MGESVLILGGSYFIGKKAASVFLQNGYKISILNRGTRPADAGIEQLTCDRNDAESLKSVLKNRHFDYVVDISWKDGQWVKSLCDSLNFESVKTFIFLSSSAVYDVDHLTAPYKETDRLAPNKYWTFYGTGKIEAEDYYTQFLSDKSTKLLILRPPYVYGEDNYAQRESLIFKHLCDGDPIVIPKSNHLHQFIYTKDLAEIMLTLVKREKAKTAIYNVGNATALTARHWVEACARAAGKTLTILEYDYQALHRSERDFFPFFDYDNVLDVQKVKTIIPQETPFVDGLTLTYQWFLENKNKIVFKANVEKNISDIIKELR